MELGNKTIIKVYTIAASIFIIIVLSVYFGWFNVINNFSLSGKPEDWGVFGDFLGGVLNPALSFLALLAIVRTMVTQQLELKETQKIHNENLIDRQIDSAENHLYMLIEKANNFFNFNSYIPASRISYNAFYSEQINEFDVKVWTLIQEKFNTKQYEHNIDDYITCAKALEIINEDMVVGRTNIEIQDKLLRRYKLFVLKGFFYESRNETSQLTQLMLEQVKVLESLYNQKGKQTDGKYYRLVRYTTYNSRYWGYCRQALGINTLIPQDDWAPKIFIELSKRPTIQ